MCVERSHTVLENAQRSLMIPLCQAGAIPFRNTGSKREFLLVTSHRGNWIFPKGVVQPGDTPESAALKETQEEAGVLGAILPGPLGSYGDRKWNRDYEVQVFLLEYSGDSDSWEERHLRHRRWCTYEDALRLIKKPEVRTLLEGAQGRLARMAAKSTN
jgi:8-oxo-dGTP pyrophosphatase MutT (NUDIX family)